MHILYWIKDGAICCCFGGGGRGADLITPFHEGEIEYFNLTLHHKRSLKDHGDEEGVWGKNNLHAMCHALNKVKGHFDDNELRRRYHRFLNTQVTRSY